ncbi:MAG: TadE/TadG family type IV pilus assembly protein [Pseudonocardiaceae bacterium]
MRTPRNGQRRASACDAAARSGGRRADRWGWWLAWWRADRGSVAAEITVITPFLIMLLVFVAVVIHRGVDARLRMDDAVHQAARAASLQRSAPAAATAARSTANGALSTAGVVCRSVGVDTDTTGLVPGGTITVTLSCTVDLRDALLLGVADHKVLSATASEPVDTWRSAAVPAGGDP